jgi:EAL domain-containing protein (putative c-di-GMP-specific phosphodiesterase class I)
VDVSGSAAIVRATIGLGRELSIKVIAEGVETTEQLELLKGWGCREAQGFYFAKPLAPDELTPLLRRGSILRGQLVSAKTAA